MRTLLALAFFCLPIAAAAQPAPDALPPPVPVWGEIETVESSVLPGPALWHITRGDSEVWILGLIGQLPKGITWNKEPLAELLQGSRAMILPPSAKVDLLEVAWFFIGNCCSLFRLDRGKLDDFLPEPTRMRLASLRESVGGDSKLYQGDEPFGAAQRLSRDFTRKNDLEGEWLLGTLNKMASEKDVKREPAFQFDPVVLIREAVKLTPQQQRPCLDAAMEDVERQKVHARAMAEAWVVGDIRNVKAHFAESRAQECLTVTVKTIGTNNQNIVPAFVTAIEAALTKPGKTIAAVGIGPLLRKDGVLERLESKGLIIEGPTE